MSVGPYADNKGAPTKRTGGDLERGLKSLEKEAEPTILVAPDAATLPIAEWTSLSEKMLDQCAKMQDRIAIFDVPNGDRPMSDFSDDPIDVFRNTLRHDDLSYGVAYYPWLNTSIVDASEIDVRNLDPAIAPQLAATGEAQDNPKAMVYAITAAYKDAMKEALRAANVMPPSAAMAGVMARTDANAGVWKAPANTTITGVLSPCVELSTSKQEDLNSPAFGPSINSLKHFTNGGVLAWGARTLDGQNRDFRYIPVRRTLIFLEQSIKAATQAYVFSPNTSSTWITVENMIRNFLNNQWKASALAGATPEDAYDVRVGLGTTMTEADILDGHMNVSVRVAVAYPAEFIALTFQQKMQTS